MNRDRGVIKWTSMMLPEHVQQLKEMAKKHEKKSTPHFDGQQLEEWSRLLAKAYHHEMILSVTTIKDGIEENVEGFVHRIDQLHRTITLLNLAHEKTTLSLHDITEINVASEFEYDE
ncbi:YolD-like family protein [Evansella sp. AB-P1]|uniref:YolD-like family protein n=1 Tax=Evansella sp. AB-P1 TaxID=3037653 RepID=UPI00241CBE34|nr:YolD-like family protein [Evansella sp. AB-P1]MDG5787706.1 YolD-like family protein [Evansella sp. AB-P1]